MAPSNPLRRRKRRLQRDKDFTGDRLSSFREVFWRHGMPGLILALALLAIPDLRTVLVESLSRASSQVTLYVAAAGFILLALSIFTWISTKQWSVFQLGWIAYLGALSLWEEWIFRLALPHVLEGMGATVWAAVLISAMAFGGLHYFTLRWKWQWCVGAFLGGLYFSHQMNVHGDLLLVAAIHWVATTFNTPKPPMRSLSADASL